MTTSLTASTYVLWISVACGQAIVAKSARRIYPGLALYLAGEVALSLIGLPSSRMLPAASFMRVFFLASYLSDALTILLVLSSLNLVRLRARQMYRSFWLVAPMLVFALFIALWPFAGTAYAAWNSYSTLYAFSHYVWTWLGVCFALLPAYSVIAGAYPNKSLGLLLAGTGLYVAANCGAIDFLLTRHFAHHKLAGTLADLVYGISLVVWWMACHEPENLNRFDDTQGLEIHAL